MLCFRIYAENDIIWQEGLYDKESSQIWKLLYICWNEF